MNAPAKKVPDAGASVPAWSELNQQWLIAAIAELRGRLDCTVCEKPVPQDGFMPALLHCARAFQLSRFEQELLLLLAGLELDQGLRIAVAALNGGQSSEASYSLAFSLLAEPHWDALSPDAPLRKFHIVEPRGAGHLTQAPLHISERMLHFISGVAATEPALMGLARLTVPPSEGDDAGWTEPAAAALKQDAVVALAGFEADHVSRHECALAVVRAAESAALWMTAGDLPADPQTLARIATIMDREVRLTGAIPVFDAHGEGREAAIRLALGMECAVIWLGSLEDMTPLRAKGKRVIRVALPKRTAALTRASLAARWHQSAPPSLRQDKMVLAELARAAGQFHLTSASLEDVVERAISAAPAHRGMEIWAAAREAARHDINGLAQRIETRVTIDDVVLPSGQKSMLADIVNQLQQRERVYHDWGFGEKHQRGQGLVALFAGESGTGKTHAAEAIANAAGLDLYRIDLATLVSKYIGETEKNLKRLFDTADASGAVLLFDEADALFGKRSEVKDSHDRYANIEVAYLLQRVEAYRGLAILTTNMKGALDRAFLRRIRFVVNFPFPGEDARTEIWRRQFPAQAPVGDIDIAALARFALPGGNIRNIAISAAFKAAEADCKIDMTLLTASAREEFAKLERTFKVNDFGDYAR